MLQRPGEEPCHAARHLGRVAEGTSDLVIPGTDLLFTRHHISDARRRATIHNCQQDLATRNEHSRD